MGIGDVCFDAFSYEPSGLPSLLHTSGNGGSLFALIVVGVQLLVCLIVIFLQFRLTVRERRGLLRDDDALIFPIYTKLLWLTAAAAFTSALVHFLLPVGKEFRNKHGTLCIKLHFVLLFESLPFCCC
jgi:hypothetical protein